MQNNLSKRQGELVKEERLKRKWTQKQLAEEAGIAKETPCRVEKGHGLGNDVARQIAKALGVRYQYLLCEDDYRTEEDFEREQFQKNLIEGEIYYDFIETVVGFVDSVTEPEVFDITLDDGRHLKLRADQWCALEKNIREMVLNKFKLVAAILADAPEEE